MIFTQSPEVLSIILEWVPFPDQITLWQTGDKLWQKLYQRCMKASPIKLTFDKQFCTKLLECNAEANVCRAVKSLFPVDFSKIGLSYINVVKNLRDTISLYGFGIGIKI
jgi:hypothetical protein